MVMCGVIILVAVVIPEVVPGKWHYGVLRNAPVELTSEISVREHKRRAKGCTKLPPAWTQ